MPRDYYKNLLIQIGHGLVGGMAIKFLSENKETIIKIAEHATENQIKLTENQIKLTGNQDKIKQLKEENQKLQKELSMLKARAGY